MVFRIVLAVIMWLIASLLGRGWQSVDLAITVLHEPPSKDQMDQPNANASTSVTPPPAK